MLTVRICGDDTAIVVILAVLFIYIKKTVLERTSLAEIDRMCDKLTSVLVAQRRENVLKILSRAVVYCYYTGKTRTA